MFTHALTRLPGENFADGLTTSQLGRPSYPLMLEQHRVYVDTLRRLGLDVTVLPPEPEYPDAYFVEDVAIVTLKVAVITRPGALARRGEELSIEPALANYRPIERIIAPGTLDGGDVLMVENHFFVGVSQRTNQEGASQLGKLLEKYGHTWEAVPVGAALHLKSSVNYAGNGVLLVTQALAEYAGFAKYQKIIIPTEEEYAANTLWVNDRLLTPRGFPKTHKMLSTLKMDVIELDTSEAHKMDGGLTCMSLRF